MDWSVDSIGTFVSLGGGFETHLDEQGRSYRWPDLWIVPESAVITQGDAIQIPTRTEDIKPGAELTAVIGEDIHRAKEAEAWDAIAGFTISNDVTASGEWPGWSDPDHHQITGIGYKVLPTFRPILTDVVSKGEIRDYDDLEITVHVDGELSVEGTTADLAFTIGELVAYASRIVPLEAGDVVALGDPGYPELYLDDASEVTCAIESIGELINPVERL